MKAMGKLIEGKQVSILVSPNWQYLTSKKNEKGVKNIVSFLKLSLHEKKILKKINIVFVNKQQW